MEKFFKIGMLLNISLLLAACSEMDFTSVAEDPQFSASVPDDFGLEPPVGVEPPNVVTPPIVVNPPIVEPPIVVEPPVVEPPIVVVPPPTPSLKDECDFGPDPVIDVCEKQIRCWIQTNYTGQANADDMWVYYDDDFHRGKAWVPVENCNSSRSSYIVFDVSSELDCHIPHYYRRPNYITNIWQYGSCNEHDF